MDAYPAASGAAFIYCPAGAVSAEMNDLAGDPSVDRVFITQEVDVMPFHRAAGWARACESRRGHPLMLATRPS